jgi:L-threonylcarbamoyladenylate synthase
MTSRPDADAPTRGPLATRVLGAPEGVEACASILAAGGLVAFPTETVYGLGARADRAEAVRAIFAAKGRPSTNPLIVHVADVDAARALAAEWPDAASRLAAAFWPGPITLVVRRREGAVADEVTASGPTVAVRVPAHPVALALLRAARVPVAAPSANASTTISPVTAAHVRKSLDGRVDAVLDGGPSARGLESTIVDVTRAPAVLLRHGAIPLADVAAIVPVVDGGSIVTAEGVRAAAPGSQERHYAPRARLVVVGAGEAGALVAARLAAGERVGLIARGPAASVGAIVVALPRDAAGFGAGLYAALHALDDAGSDVVVVEAVPADPAWAAVRDRLRRASA